MPQRSNNLKVSCLGGRFTLALWLAIAPIGAVAQDRTLDYDSRQATVAEQLPVETADWRVSQLEAGSVIAAALCFAVGFGACLLLVHHMLPALVRAQCVEIVRDYQQVVPRESEIRVVFVDREEHQTLQRPRRASPPAAPTNAESSYDLQHHLRVDQPAAPAGPAERHRDDAPNSMLSQIYEQNLTLRDQLRKQSRSVKQ